MLARLQKITTLGLIALACAWFGYFVHAGHPGTAVAGAAFILVGHAGFLAIEFLLVWFVHGKDPTPRASRLQLLAAWWNEAFLAPRVFCWYQPFRSNQFANHLPTKPELRGVVLVHGFLCNRGFWNPWMSRLRQLDIPFIAVNLEPVFGSINDYAQDIERAVSCIENATGMPPVLVGHSMGGLALRAWMGMQTTPERIHRIVTIGTPHRGTWLARFAISRNTREMAMGNDWQDRLAKRETPSRLSKFTCFYSHCDNVVFPASTATLPGADNRHVPGSAHVQLIEQEEIFSEVVRWAATA